MRKVVRYISDDDKVFNNGYECRAYEISKMLKDNKIKCINKDGNETVDATMACKIVIECDEVPEDILDELYSYCGAIELPKTKGTWIIKSGREQNDDSFCMNCSYFHKDYGEEKSCCHNDKCFEFGWVKELN